MERSPNSSPEFEFWMSSNNPPPSSSFSHPENLLSADELFCDGLILPFNTHPPPRLPDPTSSTNPPPPPPAPAIISSSPKKWKLMFRPSLREAKRMNGARSANNTELNIHIWPFSRSRSAGNNTSSGGGAGSTGNPGRGSSGRKSCSAPCSRSNSHGDSETTASCSSATKSATGAATALKKRGQLTGGIYIGRSVPVWQPRAKNQGNNNGGGGGGGGGGLKKLNVGINMLNLKNVNTCIGYGSNNVNGQASGCGGEEKEEVAGGDRSGGDVIRGGSLFKFRAIFSKKVHV